MVLEEVGAGAGDDAGLKAALARLQALLHAPRDLDQRARALVEGLALLAAGCILRAHAPAAVADAFITTRLSGSFRHTWGQGLERTGARTIIDRALPAGG